MSDDSLAHAAVFFSEAHELIQSLESTLLSIENLGVSENDVHVMFRAVHTLKGSGGLFGFDCLVQFCHVVENALDLARKGQWEFNPLRINTLLQCTDHIKLLVDAIEHDHISESLLAEGHKLLLPLTDHPEMTEYVKPEGDIEWVEDSESSQESIFSNYWHISITFHPDTLRCGLDPASILVYLKKLGTIVYMHSRMSPLTWENYDPESSYFQCDFSFDSTASRAEIDEAFDFIRDDSQIQIIPPQAKIEEYLQCFRNQKPSSHKLGEMLIKCGSITPAELDLILERQKSDLQQGIPPKKVGEILVEQKALSQNVIDEALKHQKNKSQRTSLEPKQFIKIESKKLDDLINLVGELVIAGAGAQLQIGQFNVPLIQESFDHMSDLVEQIRDKSLGLRMMPIDSVFQRFPRVIRDVSKELGKEIVLEIEGAETELDKSLIEQVTDPLTHIVRNAIDHGIETVETRLDRGKDPVGSIFMNAYHDSGNIVIEVEDDGGGLNTEKILKKAIERGIVKEDQELSETQIYNLIFEPGFSTADQVSNISGRGVGMDVVRSAVQNLHGQIEIESELGVGSLFRIRLPLTLAIIDAFLVEVGNCSFVIPLELIQECCEYPKSSDEFHDFLNLRGEALPLLKLHQTLGMNFSENFAKNVVVIRYENKRVGLVVGRLAGEFQAVIKPLSSIFNHIKEFSGSTILGDGQVAFTLDIPTLMNRAENIESIQHQYLNQ